MTSQPRTISYVAFNRQIGINSGTQEAGNQVTVVKAGGEGNSYAESDLVAKLSVGGSWSGVVDGKIMIVKVLSINTSSSPGYAQVSTHLRERQLMRWSSRSHPSAVSGIGCTSSVLQRSKPKVLQWKMQ